MRLWSRVDEYPGRRRKDLSPVWRLPLAVALALGTILALVQVPSLSAQEDRPAFDINQVTVPSAPPAARLGAGSYQENCAPCHGLQGMGDGPSVVDLPSPPTAFADPDAVWERSPAELFHTAKFGWLERLMPPWQNQLSDGEIWQTVAYAWSLHTNEQDFAQGADLYATSCAECHGETGAGDGPEATEDVPDFTDAVYAMSASQADWMAGWQTAHPEVGEEWTLAEQRNVLEYVRGFTYVPAWESGLRPGEGVIRGRVTQGTAGGPEVEGGTVMLEAFVDFQPVAAYTSTVSAEGTFEFAELGLDPNVVYLASISSGGVRYSSPIVTLTAEQPESETAVTVFETTDDPSGITLDRVHWILDSQPGALMVLQVLEFGNSGDRTYIGTEAEGIEGPVTVAFNVPAAAMELSFENGALGGRFQQTGELIYDTTPLVPGAATKQIVMQYALPYEGDSLALEQDFAYPILLLNMLVADLPGLTVETPDLTSMGVQDFQGTAYQIWRGEEIEAGPLTLSLSGLLRSGDLDPRGAGGSAAGAPAANAAAQPVAPFALWMAWAIGLAVTLMLTGVLAWSWRAGRLEGGESPETLRRQREELVRRVARLDDLHALGEVSQDGWQVQRAQLKSKLMEIDGRLAEPGKARQAS